MKKLIRIGFHGHYIIIDSEEKYDDRGDFVCDVTEVPSIFAIGVVIDNNQPGKVVYGDITFQFSAKREDCFKITHSTKTGVHPTINQLKAEELLGTLNVMDLSNEVFHGLLI